MKYFIVFIFLFIFVCGCSREQFEFQAFTFPSNIPFHEHSWKKACVISLVFNTKGSAYELGDKKIIIKILDSHSHEKKVAEYVFNAAYIYAKVNWLSESEFNLELWEKGSGDAKSSYSRQLSIKGEKLLASDIYSVDVSGNWVLIK